MLVQLRDVLALARVAAGAEVIAVAGGLGRRLLRDDPLAPVMAEGGDGVVILLAAARAGALIAAGLGAGRLRAGGGLIAVVMALGGDDLIDLHAAARAGADGAAGLRAGGVRDEVAAAQVMAERGDLLGAGRAAGRAFIKRRALLGAGGRVRLRLDPGVVGGGDISIVHGGIGAALHRADVVRVALLRAGGVDDRVGELGDVVAVPETGLVALPRAVVLERGGPGMAALRVIDHAVIREGAVGIRRAVDALGGVVFEDGALELRDLCDLGQARSNIIRVLFVPIRIVRVENPVEDSLDGELQRGVHTGEGAGLNRVDPVAEVSLLEQLAAGKGALVDLRDAVGEIDGLHVVIAGKRGLADREGLVTGAEGEVVHIIIAHERVVTDARDVGRNVEVLVVVDERERARVNDLQARRQAERRVLLTEDAVPREGPRADIRQAVRQAQLGEHGAAVKRVVLDAAQAAAGARAHEGERVAAVEGVLIDELEIARHVDGREVLVRIKRTIADGGDAVVEEHARQVLAVLEGAVADIRDAGERLFFPIPLLGGRTGDVGQSQILLAEVFHDGRAELLPLVVILRDLHVAHPRGFLTLDRVVRHRAVAEDIHAVILRVLAIVVDLPDLLQEGVVLHDRGVRDFVNLIMYAGLVPGGAAIAMGDLIAEKLFDLAGLFDELLKRIRDRARLRRRGAHAQQSGREHKAQQQRQHSFFHMVPPSWNGHTGKYVYTASIQDAPRFCNGSRTHGHEKIHILFTQTQQNVTIKTFFRRYPLHTFPVIWYIFDR